MITDSSAAMFGSLNDVGVRDTVAGVVTLNVQHAAAGRAHRQIDWLAELAATDVVVLTEVPADSSAHVQALAEHGYSVASSDGGGDLQTLVASRAGSISQVPFYTGRMGYRFTATRVDLPDGRALGVVGLYVPSRGPQHRRNEDKRSFQNDVTAALPHLADAYGLIPVLVTGDLNVVETGHRPHHEVFGAWEYAFYTSFATNGLTDAFRHHQPDLVDHSWFGQSGRGYRFDHMFITAGHTGIVTSCRYLHEPRTSGLSDHSALAATITLPTG
jgi:exodeoxyribonuclease-3